MREIKFRGKRIDNGEWLFGYVQFNEDKKSAWIYKSKEDDWTVKEQFPVIPETVGQYTNLKDRHGKEVYEGDILWHYKVVWNEIRAKFEAIHIIDGYGLSPDTVAVRYEIIGNIYEHHHLLKGANTNE